MYHSSQAGFVKIETKSKLPIFHKKNTDKSYEGKLSNFVRLTLQAAESRKPSNKGVCEG